MLECIDLKLTVKRVREALKLVNNKTHGITLITINQELHACGTGVDITMTAKMIRVFARNKPRSLELMLLMHIVQHISKVNDVSYIIDKNTATLAKIDNQPSSLMFSDKTMVHESDKKKVFDIVVYGLLAGRQGSKSFKNGLKVRYSPSRNKTVFDIHHGSATKLGTVKFSTKYTSNISELNVLYPDVVTSHRFKSNGDEYILMLDKDKFIMYRSM